MIMQKICLECNKDIIGYDVVDNKCPHCDEILKYKTVKFKPDPFFNMDSYYSSCTPPKETIGSLADKNTKKMGGLVPELEYNKKQERFKAMKEKFGSAIPHKSGNRPFYRPNSDKPIIAESRNVAKKNRKGFKG